MERNAVVEAQLTAETVWYSKGKMDRLALVQDVGLLYMDSLADWERQMEILLLYLIKSQLRRKMSSK